jgi:hypothetical protein
MSHNAQPARPRIPSSYGVSASKEGLLGWRRVLDRLDEARNYWISTTRPDGRPHASPVWGVVVAGQVAFGLDADTVKGRNIEAGSFVALHLESGDDVVIVEGTAELLDGPDLLGAVRSAYIAKYDVDVMGDDGSARFYTLRARTAFAWLEADFPNTATRFDFPALESNQH